MDTTTPTRTRQQSCCGTTSGGSHSEAIDREGVKMSDEDCDVVAEFIRSRGITRCPTACVLPTQGLIAAADRIALEQYAVARDRVRRASRCSLAIHDAEGLRGASLTGDCQYFALMPASARISIRLRRIIISHRSWSPRVFLHTRLVALKNTLLAARTLGLGATLTTLYLQFEKEAEVALGLPPNVHSHALLPVGYPMGRFGPVRRIPLADVVYEDRWGQAYRGL